jgi:hypothetical protein
MPRLRKRNALAYASLLLSACYLLFNIFKSRPSSACPPSGKTWLSGSSISEHPQDKGDVFGPGKRSRIDWGKQVPRTKVVRSKWSLTFTWMITRLKDLSRLSRFRGIRQSVHTSRSLRSRLGRQGDERYRANRDLGWRTTVQRLGRVSCNAGIRIWWNCHTWHDCEQRSGPLADIRYS